MTASPVRDLLIFVSLTIVAMSSFGCAHLQQTTHIQPVGEKTTESVFRQEPPRVEVEVLKMRDMRVIEGRFRVCTRRFLKTTQPQVEITEKTTSPSAGALAGGGLGALALGAAVAIFGQCENNDSSCSSGRGVAAVVGAGAFVGLEVSALVNGVRSIDEEREAPPEEVTTPTNGISCLTKPIQAEEVWATIHDKRVTLGTLTNNGRLILTPALANDLALMQGMIAVGVGETSTTLDLRTEHSTQCAAAANRLSASSDLAVLAESLQQCSDTDSATALHGRIDDVHRNQRAAALPPHLPKGSPSNAASAKSKVDIVLGCIKDVGAANLCDSFVTSVFKITAPIGVATTGSMCNALTQAITNGTLDGWEIAVAGGKALLFALFGEIGEIAALGAMAVDFGQCLVEEGILR